MHKRDYFIRAIQAGAYKYKAWVYSAFSVVKQQTPRSDVPYLLYLDAENGLYWFMDPVTDAQTYLDGTPLGEAPFAFREEVVVAAKELPNVNVPTVTTYGNVFLNAMLLVYPFGGKIPFMTGKMSIGAIEKIIEARLKDDPPAGTTGLEETEDLYVSEYIRYSEAAFSLVGYSSLCVPTFTARTLTTDPQIKVRRAQLVEQYKDQLHDPVIQAKIGDELIEMDRAWVKGDLGEGFYNADKAYNVIRKKLYIMQGAEEGFGVRGELITTSLNDGWLTENLPAMGNALRDGSYSRGAQTALGGEATKFNYRMFQNARISSEDCGSVLGLRMYITGANKMTFLGRTVFTPKGLVELNAENLDTFVGRDWRVRSPAFCRNENQTYCATCFGKSIATTPDALSTYAASIGSLFMKAALKKMHGSSLSVARYDPQKSIS